MNKTPELEHYLLARLFASPRLLSSVAGYKLDRIVRNLDFIWYTDHQNNPAPLYVFNVQICVTCSSMRMHKSGNLGTVSCQNCAATLDDYKVTRNDYFFAAGMTSYMLHLPKYVAAAVDKALVAGFLLRGSYHE